MVPGLYKIFDEILVNAADNKQRDPSMDAIKVTIDTAKNKIQVWNNGRGIPVEVHAKEGCYVPELIFGHLLTSSNYDDSARKTTGGRNGYGAKLANIFSTEFVVETADGSRQKKYKQVFSKNMSVKKEPVIKVCKPTDNFTSITFHPDLAKFGLDSLDADHVALMSRRVVDVAGCLGKSVKVTLNGTRVPVKSFADYAGLYLAPPPPPTPQPPATPPSSGEGGSGGGGGEGGEGAGAEGGVSAAEAAAAAAAAAAHPSTHEKLPRSVSFVNAIATTRGGTHVNMVSEQIVRYLLDKAQKKAATGKHGSASGAAAIKPHQIVRHLLEKVQKKASTGKHGSASGAAAIKPHQVRSQLWVFVNCLVVNPAFDSQTKERLNTRPSVLYPFSCLPMPLVRSQLWVFVNCLVVNPAFDSQTKETLNTRPSDFGATSRKTFSRKNFLKKVAAKCGIVEHLLSLAAHKQTKDLKRSDGSKRQRVSGITKLDDANEAGGRNAEHCTLILTEGDSAKTLAVRFAVVILWEVKLDDAKEAGGRNAEHCTLILTEGDSAKTLAVRESLWFLRRAGCGVRGGRGSACRACIVKLDDAKEAGGRNAEHCTLILTEGDSAKTLAVRESLCFLRRAGCGVRGGRGSACRACIVKLDDANEAGGRNAEHCTHILTEGDSVKTLAVSGLSVVGRDRYGVFPLRGKLLNVRDASHRQMMENTEIGHLKQILGLQHGKSYESVKALRYGHLMIMTDQDHDGSHIKGLLINLLHSCWPSLLKHPSFLREFITPIVKATGPRGRTLAFYTIPEYEAWKRTLGSEARQWKVKYYKGLGTSTPKEAKEYFAQLDRHRKDFEWRGEGDGERIEMAFSKKAVDARKQWLRSYEVSGGVGWRKSAGGRDWVGEGDGERIEMAFSKKAVDARKQWLCSYEPGTYLDQTAQRISYSDFVDKELILYSIADNMRSIPSVVDGLKPGQRKILFSCFKRKLHSDIKVAQLAGYVSEHAAYHHGEQSLMSTIVNLAQDFVGSNNVHLLVPSGQFGTRLQGGKDAASPRYIYTRLHRLTRVIFPVADDALLDYLDDDGQRIEPKWYVPILPMVLINGSEGIGTGWSSYVPTFNPRDVVANLKRRMRGEPMLPMHPWFRGFKGSIQLTSARQGGGNSYTVTGVATRLASSSGGRKGEKQPQQQGVTGVAITELPIRTWTQNYKEFLEGMMGGAGGGHGGGEGGGKVALIKDMREYHTDTSVHFEVEFTAEGAAYFMGEGGTVGARRGSAAAAAAASAAAAAAAAAAAGAGAATATGTATGAAATAAAAGGAAAGVSFPEGEDPEAGARSPGSGDVGGEGMGGGGAGCEGERAEGQEEEEGEEARREREERRARAQWAVMEKRLKLTTTMNTGNMHLFDADGRMKKYDSPEDIVEDFYGIRLGYYEQRKEHQLVQLRHDLPFPYLLPIYLFLSWFILSFLLPFTVIEDFYGIRLGYYEQRKEHQLAQLRHELLRLDNRARFVRAVIQGDVVITNRKQADIVAQLKVRAGAVGLCKPVVSHPPRKQLPLLLPPRKGHSSISSSFLSPFAPPPSPRFLPLLLLTFPQVRGFTPLPKGHAAAPVVVADVDPGSTDVSADGDDVEMDDVETPAGHKAGKGKNTAAAGKSGAAGKTAAAGAVPSAGAVGAAYEYLLGMPLWSLTWERVEQLERERRGKEEEVVVLQATSPLQLWERDLDLFLETLEQHQQQCCEEEEVVPLQSTSPQQL
ncbi:unnamed protein product [Closterium sp. Naga37s-1]|nr:unnamed protein product [Closterium sp. Naga37s-1]